MANHTKKLQSKPIPAKSETVGISKNGYKVIGFGILVLAVGYFVLTKTDPFGQNLASKISPFLILGGYVLIGLGIILPEKTPDVDVQTASQTAKK